MSGKRSKYQRAVALDYDDSGSDAPKVAFKGEQLMADEMVKIAERYGIPVVHKPELAAALSKVEADSQIPKSLFEAVAVLFNELRLLAERKIASARAWRENRRQ